MSSYLLLGLMSRRLGAASLEIANKSAKPKKGPGGVLLETVRNWGGKMKIHILYVEATKSRSIGLNDNRTNWTCMRCVSYLL